MSRVSCLPTLLYTNRWFQFCPWHLQQFNAPCYLRCAPEPIISRANQLLHFFFNFGVQFYPSCESQCIYLRPFIGAKHFTLFIMIGPPCSMQNFQVHSVPPTQCIGTCPEIAGLWFGPHDFPICLSLNHGSLNYQFCRWSNIVVLNSFEGLPL